MVENHPGSNDLLDTTDCLEAVGVFKGWKNLLFVILVVCMLLLQASFYLVDQGYVEITGQAYGDEPSVEPTPYVEPAEPNDSDKPTPPVVSDTPAEPNESVEIDRAGGGRGEPEEANEPAGPGTTPEPNLGLLQPGRQEEPGLQLAALPFTDFLSKITWAQLSWTMNLVNSVLILTAILYCLTLLFSLKVSMHGRLGGINHITRAFFLSLLMVVLLLPWQEVFGSVVTGAVFTPTELARWCSHKTEDMLDIILYYVRFSGYGGLMLLLLILSQVRSLRWAKAILRRLEII
ncbi:MAG: hypothetical protein JSW47_13235 [Phycisphaerales bacterium]|nr:MAG: hypothetical protein JSW47_13235 [Phycisphaerales bacterium]